MLRRHKSRGLGVKIQKEGSVGVGERKQMMERVGGKGGGAEPSVSFCLMK